MSLNALERQDGLCLLLPAQWLESDYARELRMRLWSLRQRRVEIHLFDDKLFHDAEVDAVALVVGPEQDLPQPLVFSRGEHVWTPDRSGSAPIKWRGVFDGTTVEAEPTGVRLGDLLNVRRGVATGANGFFVIPERRVRETVAARSALTPLIRRLNGMPDVVTNEVLGRLPDDNRYWLLTATEQSVERLKGLSSYIDHGVDRGFNRRHLCQSRRRWYDLTAEVFRPDLVIGQSTKKVFRILENRAGATLVNNLYGMSWKPDVDELTRAEVLTWLRSQEGQRAITAQSRTQGAGLKKIEPKALLQVQLPPRFKPPQGILA